MQKLKCHCGQIIETGKIFSDKEQAHSHTHPMITCNHCQRIYIYKNGFENESITYVREDFSSKFSFSGIFDLDSIMIMNGLSLLSGIMGIFLMYLFHLPVNAFMLPFLLIYALIVNISYLLYMALAQLIFGKEYYTYHRQLYLIFVALLSLFNLIFPSLSFGF